MEKHIYFVRHGQSEENVDGIYRGAAAELTEEGRKQADAVADRIARIGVEAIISSPFRRAHDTALAISKLAGVPAEVCSDLGEWLEPTSFFGKPITDEERAAGRRAVLESIHNPHYRHEDEETFTELKERGARVLEFLKMHSAERICVVSHGGFLRIMLGVILFGENFSKANFTDFMVHFLITNTGITYARFNDSRGWHVVTWNDQSHLG